MSTFGNLVGTNKTCEIARVRNERQRWRFAAVRTDMMCADNIWKGVSWFTFDGTIDDLSWGANIGQDVYVLYDTDKIPTTYELTPFISDYTTDDQLGDV
jgi:hypothetical protein